jgi:hypothetical protein
MLPLPRSGCPALVARGPSGSTKKPARALAAERGMQNEECRMQSRRHGLIPAEIALMWQTAPPRTPIPRPQIPGDGAFYQAKWMSANLRFLTPALPLPPGSVWGEHPIAEFLIQVNVLPGFL